jgi:maltooligosyltrehalose trehalohydrolase
LPAGAELLEPQVAEFRVWAPAVRRLEVVLGDGRRQELSPDRDGYFVGRAVAAAGERYGLRVNGSERLYPDPASRFQPTGPHGLSEIVDPNAFAWTDDGWQGPARAEAQAHDRSDRVDDGPLRGQIIYELHAGTFTPEGTWTGAARQLPELADLGITIVELMPVAEFEGRFGWGYDGVSLYAPSHLYGAPDDLRRFVDRAHALGMSVILDVVYNHLGPVGNYLRVFSPAYFTDRYENEWGDALNFDGDESAPVREFFVANAGYWIDEFHMDGLRLDATQQIFDRSPTHVMTEIGSRVREHARGRSTIVVAENEPQDSRLIRPASEGGCGLDGLWNDDFHHSAMVALTGRAEAYYGDTRGVPQELVSAAKYGYLFQGQYYHWQRKRRGTPSLNVAPSRFVVYLQNHDQVANSARGLRGHQISSPAAWRAMTALLLLMPGTPMLFQGQEFAASAPFLYFADFEPDLAAAVRKGRAEFLTQFPSLAAYAEDEALDDPGDVKTFERCKLDFRERHTHAAAYALHRDLIRLRRESAAFRSQRWGGIDGAVLSEAAFVLRYFTADPSDTRLVIVNLGPDLNRASFAEPLLAPPDGHDWHLAWSSEHPRYGGGGIGPRADDQWGIPAQSTTVLAPGVRGTSAVRPVSRRTA